MRSTMLSFLPNIAQKQIGAATLRQIRSFYCLDRPQVTRARGAPPSLSQKTAIPPMSSRMCQMRPREDTCTPTALSSIDYPRKKRCGEPVRVHATPFIIATYVEADGGQAWLARKTAPPRPPSPDPRDALTAWDGLTAEPGKSSRPTDKSAWDRCPATIRRSTC